MKKSKSKFFSILTLSIVAIFLAACLVGFAACDMFVSSGGDDESGATVSSVSIDVTELALEAGETGTIEATVVMTDSDESYTGSYLWSSSNADVATVSGDSVGTVIAVSAGSAAITVTAGNKSASAVVIVSGENDGSSMMISSVSVDRETLSLVTGGDGSSATATLTTVVTMSDGSEYKGSYTWTSADMSVAMVSGNGASATVGAVGYGTTYITVTAGDKSATCTVTVTGDHKVEEEARVAGAEPDDERLAVGDVVFDGSFVKAEYDADTRTYTLSGTSATMSAAQAAALFDSSHKACEYIAFSVNAYIGEKIEISTYNGDVEEKTWVMYGGEADGDKSTADGAWVVDLTDHTEGDWKMALDVTYSNGEKISYTIVLGSILYGSRVSGSADVGVNFHFTFDDEDAIADGAAVLFDDSVVTARYKEATKTYTLTGNVVKMTQEQAAAFYNETEASDHTDCYYIGFVINLNEGETATFTTYNGETQEKQWTDRTSDTDNSFILDLTNHTEGDWSMTIDITDAGGESETYTIVLGRFFVEREIEEGDEDAVEGVMVDIDFGAEYTPVYDEKSGKIVSYELTSVPKDESDTYLAVAGYVNGVSVSVGGYLSCQSNKSTRIINYIETLFFEDGVTSIGDYAFYYCAALESVVFSDTVTEIGDHAFYSSKALESIEFSDGITKIGDCAFAKCSALTSIAFWDGLREIGESAFSDCTGFVGCIEIPSSVTSIDMNAFEGCNNSNLTSVVIHGSKNETTYIGANAFEKCSYIDTVTFDGGTFDIGHCAFEYCNNLATLIIINGADFASVAVEAFRNNASSGVSPVETVYYDGAEAEWNAVKAVFNESYTNIPSGCAVYYYSEIEDSGCWHWVDGSPVLWSEQG